MKSPGKRFLMAACLIPGLAWAAVPVPPGSARTGCLKPNDIKMLRRCAREASWTKGRLDESTKAYRAYLAARPDDAKAWLEYAQVEIWLGDYGTAGLALEHYRKHFGDDRAYRQKRARLLARAEWPDAAAALNDPLLAANPRDYDLNYTQTLILRADHRPAEAIDSLRTLQSLRPDSRDTADITRFVRTPFRSHLRAGFSYYNDSDDITIRRATVDGRYVLNNKRTALMAGYGDEHLKARLNSGLEVANGNRGISLGDTWVGVEHRWSPQLLTELRAGVTEVNGGDRIDTHRLSLQWNPHDNLALQLVHRRALYDLSPRSVSLGIIQTANRIDLNWRPNLDWFIDAQTGHSDFSDTNREQRLVIAPRRAVVRREHFKLDLGVSGEWFSFDKDFDHGYYDPDQYRRYALTAFSYWKIDDDNGVGTALSLGWHKDNHMSDFKFGEDISVVGYFGIFRNWYLTVRTGYVKRYNTIGNYDGFTANASLMRRFR